MINKSRSFFLVIIAIATAVTLGKSIVHSEVKASVIKSYTFPKSIALSQWKLSSTKPINPRLVKPPAYIPGDFIAGKHYRYLKNNQYLDIEMRYLANTNGDLKSFITDRTGDLSSVLKQDSEGGFYSLYSNENKAYLSTCINSRGGSTITSDRFKRNRTIYDTRLERIIPWLLGQAELQDKRCIWAHLSIPLEQNATTEQAYLSLETAWQDWYDYWRSHYPDN